MCSAIFLRQEHDLKETFHTHAIAAITNVDRTSLVFLITQEVKGSQRVAVQAVVHT